MIPNEIVFFLIIAVFICARQLNHEHWLPLAIMSICAGTLGNVIARRTDTPTEK